MSNNTKRVIFAERTSVSIAQTKADIERELMKYGATSFAFATRPDGASVMFDCQHRRVRFELPLKDTGSADRNAKLHRSRWRALLLCLKAKLVSVESNVATFDQEFCAFIVLPSTGQTVGDALKVQIELAYNGGTMPLMLGGPST